jgi:hypothetical protein
MANELEVKGTLVVIDSATGSASIACQTNEGPIQLRMPGDVFLTLRDQMAGMLAQMRHGGLYMLPAVKGCHGLEILGIPPRLHIRLVLEDGKEGRLPIQESALSRLQKLAGDWFAEEQERNSEGNFDEE